MDLALMRRQQQQQQQLQQLEIRAVERAWNRIYLLFGFLAFLGLVLLLFHKTFASTIWEIVNITAHVIGNSFWFSLMVRSPLCKVGAALGGLFGSVFGLRVGGPLGLVVFIAVGFLLGGLLGNGMDDLFNLSAGDPNYFQDKH